MYEKREVFAYAPLALVTAEIRLGYEPTLRDQATLEAIGGAVRAVLPLLESGSTANFSFEASVGTMAASESMPFLRAFNRARTVSAAVSVQSLTVSATEYRDFEDFLNVILTCLGALSQRVPDASVTRVGLRYIDEVRAPVEIKSSDQWSEWISGQLLAPTGLVSSEAVEGISGSLVYHRTDESRVHFRWGEAYGGSVLDSSLALRRLTEFPRESRFFVLDVDSFWEPSLAQPLDVSALVSRLGELHTPAGLIFAAAITDEGRQMFREGIDG